MLGVKRLSFFREVFLSLVGVAEKATGAFSEKAIQGVSTMPIPFASVKKMKLKEQLP